MSLWSGGELNKLPNRDCVARLLAGCSRFIVMHTKKSHFQNFSTRRTESPLVAINTTHYYVGGRADSTGRLKSSILCERKNDNVFYSNYVSVPVMQVTLHEAR